MLHSTKAIVLRTIEHGDRTTVLQAYTEAFGARSYMVRAKAQAARLQPMARLELVVTERRDRDMQAVREIRVERPWLRVPAEHERMMLLLFAQEVFCRTLREEAPDAGLFAFVQQVLEDIDTRDALADQPLLLLLRLAGHLGFAPEAPGPGEDLFDLREGRFTRGMPPQEFLMDKAASAAFKDLLHAEERGEGTVIGPAMRGLLFRHLLTYFRLHVEGFGQLRSPEVLHALMH